MTQMKKSVTKSGLAYEIPLMPAVKGLQVIPLLGKLFSGMISGANKSENEMIGDFLTSIDAETFEKAMTLMLDTVIFTDKKGSWSTILAGRYSDMIEIIQSVIEVNGFLSVTQSLGIRNQE